jgi:hypothetical protein
MPCDFPEHHRGGGHGSGFPVLSVVAVLGGVAVCVYYATEIAQLVTAALVVTSLAAVAMVAGLTVKVRRGRRELVQWHRPAVLPAAAPVKAISGKQAGVYVITGQAERSGERMR